MPAVTTDTIALPRVARPGLEATERKVVSVTSAPSGLEGEGFPVRRAFAGVDLATLDPFVHMDQMGEVDYAPGEPKGTPWHPHRGFETVTYMIDGVFRHQDSNGGGGLITDGDTQWMTAGAGILHIEAPPEEVVVRGGLFHGFQLWVNLPARLKWSPPRYQDIRGGEVKLLSSSDGGALLRVIAGEVTGHEGPGITYTPITLLHATLAPGARLELPWRSDFNALVYVLAGSGSAGVERRPVRIGQLAVYGPGDVVTVSADASQESRSPNLDVLILGGEPIREPVAAYGPFVMNTREELVQAFEDYQAGRLGSIPAEPHPGHEVLKETAAGEPQS
jgi:redox-sensitive bicupin YhaK (pirin superfamily)